MKKIFVVLLFGLTAAAFAQEGEEDPEIVRFTEVIRQNPGDANAYLSRGNAWSEKGDHDRAMADWEKVLQINPNLSQARNNLERLRQMGY
jgi:tetratricopeptide (TPR) repeat protein